MKTIHTLLLLASLATGIALIAAEPPTNAPVGVPAPLPNPTNTAGPGETKPPAPTPEAAGAASTNAAATNLAATSLASTNLSSTNLASPDLPWTNAPSIAATNFPKDGLRLNFRRVPLEMVLNYLSEAAGFVIVLETDVRGTVDAWSNQPLNKEEAVDLLNSVLNKNGYAAIRNGRTLTIVPRDAAKTRDIPVKRGNEPSEIPKNDEIVTQVIPIRYINAGQLTKDLQLLLPLQATMTADEPANALVITDTQTSIHRMTEIIRALDTAMTNASTVRVYPLKFADAKTVATVIKDLFQSQDTGQRNPTDIRAQFFQRMRGGGMGGGFGGPGGLGGGDQSGGSGGGRNQPPKVVATSDDRSNSLVVSAPDELIPTIDDLVKAIDTNVEDITEVRVFRLTYSDPVEMADLLAGLFPDETRNGTDNTMTRGTTRFSGPGMGRFSGGGGPGGAAGAAGQQSDRMKKMSRVLAVPDPRTASVIVSAARDLMVQIAGMIEQLDNDPAKQQKVYVYSLENADVQQVEQVIRNMFDRNGTMNSRNTANQNSVLSTRSTQNTQGTTGNSSTRAGGGASRGGGGLGSSGF
ncbi:MAG: hypothetical protein NTW03_09820 [Verrucomicrobia bacterium]|nr:hypothetical protein [Verrucomicrobiota bacterium]